MLGLDTTFAKLATCTAVCFALLAPAVASAATIQVDSATDDGAGCTIREAIASADGNADSGGCTGSGAYGDDTITFAPAVVSVGTIPLQSQLTIDPTMAGTLEISGPGVFSLEIDGQNAGRVIGVTANANTAANEVEISGLTLTGGRIDALDPNFVAQGGGVHNLGRLTLDRVTVSGNDILVSVAGDDVVFGNAQGGGIYNEGTLTLSRSTVSGNTASFTATTTGFVASADAKGGGVYTGPGAAIIRQSTISQNTASAHAGGASGSNLSSAEGGGVALGDNATGQPGNMTVAAATIVGNTATATGSPGAGVNTQGGGAFASGTSSSPSLSLNNSTLAANNALQGANVLKGNATFTLRSTVLAEPGGTNCLASTSPSSAGHNLVDDNSCAFAGTGDINNTPANLRPLDINGGPTETRPPAAPQAGSPSPLIDAGVAAGQTLDQRGFARTVEYDLTNGAGGDGTDIGAVEIQGATPTSTTPASPNDDATPEVRGTAAPLTTVHLFGDQTCTTEIAIGNPQDFGDPGFTVGPLALGSTTHFRATAEYGTATSLCSPTGVSYTRPPPPPAAPVLSGSSPASPGDDATPTILGSADPGATVNLYTASDCTGTLAGSGSAADLASPGIEVSVPHNTSATFYAQATGAGGTSPCSSTSVSYTTRPGAPVLSSTSPASPGDDETPTVIGTADSGTTVNVYTTSDCTGAVAGTGSASDLSGAGIGVSVPHNTTATFYAQATSANGASPCSSTSVAYATRPAAPLLTSTTPASPANDNDPRVKGTASAGVTVNLYTAPTCTGTLAGTGSASDLAGPGISVSVPDNSTTTFYAQATSANGASPCSAGLAYTESTPPATKPDPGGNPQQPGKTHKPKCKKKPKKRSAAAAAKCKKRPKK